VEAARRVLIDVGQVLASFADCFVLVGGWLPHLWMPDEDDPHSGSIDVDLALDAEQLKRGRYAELLRLILATGRYVMGPRDFQFTATVDLQDGLEPIQVSVDFLAPTGVMLRGKEGKLIEGFRVLEVEACVAALHKPGARALSGRMISGAENTVEMRVASIPAFLVMKAHALARRDKPKDAYDLCYCLDNWPGGLPELAGVWRARLAEGGAVASTFAKALSILRQKFASVTSYGPQQVVAFHDAASAETRARQARRAFELVDAFIRAVEVDES
jgi:predicted nucleotidyltransferase